MTVKPIVVQVVLDKPLVQAFDYLWSVEKLGKSPDIGDLVEVPFGHSKDIGVVIRVSEHSEFATEKLKTVECLAPLPPLNHALLSLMNFASQYYVHALGETILPAIPLMWKKAEDWEKIPRY